MLQNISFISHCSPSLSTSVPPLTADNVLTAVQGMHWRRLGEELLPGEIIQGTLYYPKVDEIQQQHLSDGDRLRAVVETWVQGGGIHKEPSWRGLIWALDYLNMTGVADTIRDLSEPVLGKSCDSISVSTFLYSV